MRHKNPLRSLLGLTQNELAELLQVGRPLLSLHELGRRGLPLQAQRLLADMLAHVQAASADRRSPLQDRELYQESVRRQLRENEYQRLKAAREITATEQRIDKESRRARLSEFLAERDRQEGKAKTSPRPRFAPKRPANDTQTDLIRLQLRQELLELEKNFLESKLDTTK
ncbi:hypothetical protein HUK80_16295 [Flavobacterium sp. MAH-1]|uniref:HTH cro/C1-type domain-containing protein n=1 Tax=Flavobacterium agri TaxID=2743471 RepID=A0A7Y8Y4R0_9FLAO|nr:hypothetical protein [Flavobacterium agri]NUY82467.1 hypothetical protein [Flavobacterium agri]NYA72491.1 hypothetical protein [Flavobacterium agri]